MLVTRTPLTTVHDWIKPAGDDATIARSVMPQIDDADIPTLLAYLGSLDVKFSAGRIDPKCVRSHQAIDKNMALSMPKKYLKTPSLISREPIVIDGNHRWYNHLAAGTMMPFIRIEEDFETALALIDTFPKTYEDKR